MQASEEQDEVARRERVKDIMFRALQNAARQTDRFLELECANDRSLRDDVESLLHASGHNPRFLSAPTASEVPATTISRPSSPERDEEIGSCIGPYKLLEKLGEGGFGSVFMAEQQTPVHQRVAIKIIKPGLDSKQVVARFEQERQSLAMMDHPNIARVLDMGQTESGRPYLVMELVRGFPLTDFCDSNRLPLEVRLGVFVDICNAVQHSHGKGVIHRDLSPSNIMVTMCDGTPVAKVIDFGIAKVLQGPISEKTVYTQLRQFVGKPAYAAPEQAELGFLDVDTRADVYALGVVLYELLTGTTPIPHGDFVKAGLAGIHRLICETEVMKPSTRVGSLEGRLEFVASHRRVEPERLGVLLRGELDWIVMKAIEKGRERRYRTAHALAEDVRRFLDGEPVAASPRSIGFRLWLFVWRHRIEVILWITLVPAVGVLLGLYLAGLPGGVGP